MSEFVQYANENNVFINSENALEYSNSFYVEPEIVEFDKEFIDERRYIIRSMAGFSDSDVVDDHLKMKNFLNAKIIDVDGNIKYNGSDRRSFWDAFRELTYQNIFPIYNCFIVYDSVGDFELTIEITSYYP